MPAHAALPLIRTRENRPFRSQGARWTASSAMQRYIDSISFFRRPDLSPTSAPRHFYSLSLPYLSLSLLSLYLMYDTPLCRRRSGADARLVFGTDHSPLSLRIWPCLGTSRGKKYTWSMLPLPTQRYVFMPRMKKNSPNSLAETAKIPTIKARRKRNIIVIREFN